MIFVLKINVIVYPKSSQKKIIKSDDVLKVYLHEAPVGGKANKMLIKELAKYYKTSKTNIKIVCGEKNKRKIIEIIE